MGMYTNVKFESTNKSYTFMTEDESIKVNDFVVVETNRGIEIGICVSELREQSNLPADMEVKPILRKATDYDIKQARSNEDSARDALKICQEEALKLNLEMRVVSAEYTLDRSKVTFIYVANDRVDFRELLKVLAAIFKCRIDLRQIGARDKAKIVSGIGVCGHELCCGRFLNDFDMVSFNMAKNQGLALNTSKLSGHCGKLMCCLKFEDDAYTDAKKDLPRINTPCEYNGEIWKLNSINIINSTVRLENQGNFETLSFLDFFKNCNYKDKKEINLSEYIKEEPVVVVEEVKPVENKEVRNEINKLKHSKKKLENMKNEDVAEAVVGAEDKPANSKSNHHHHHKHHNNKNQTEKKESNERTFKPAGNKNDGEEKQNNKEGSANKNHHRRRHFHKNNKNKAAEQQNG